MLLTVFRCLSLRQLDYNITRSNICQQQFFKIKEKNKDLSIINTAIFIFNLTHVYDYNYLFSFLRNMNLKISRTNGPQ